MITSLNKKLKIGHMITSLKKTQIRHMITSLKKETQNRAHDYQFEKRNSK